METIPTEIKDKIFESFSSLPDNIVEDIKGKKIQGSNSIMSAIENYYRPFGAIHFYNKLIEILEKHELICYHATKVKSKNVLLRNGLKINDWKIYSANLTAAYVNIGMVKEKIQEALDIIKCEYSRKYEELNRNAQLCFFSNLSMLKGEHATYDQFCENIGGELARWALKNKYPDLYGPLKENGKGCVVKFKMPYSKIADYEKDRIAYQFVIFYAGLYFWNKEYDIQFDGNTQYDVPPEDILDIIDLNKNIDY